MNDGNFETHLSMALIYPQYRFYCVNEYEHHLPPPGSSGVKLLNFQTYI